MLIQCSTSVHFIYNTDNLDSTLEKVFGPTMLAIEFQGKEYEINISSSDTSDGDENIGTSTPAKET